MEGGEEGTRRKGRRGKASWRWEMWFKSGRAAGHHAAHFQLPLSPQGLPNATVATAGMSCEPEQRV